MTRSEEIGERFREVCLQILRDCRTELYLGMRYLDLALSSLRFQITTEFPGIGTDGASLIADPRVLADRYEADRRAVNRVYLHLVMHCLMRHPFLRPGRDGRLWRLSCDMAVESVIDSLTVRAVRVGVSRLRKNWYDLMKTKMRVLTAQGIYLALSQRRLTDPELVRLEEEFEIDDHSLWPAPKEDEKMPPPQMEMLRDKWQEISEKTRTQMETFSREAAQGGGQIRETIAASNRRRQDYRSFLRKFALLREQVQVDPEAFDYVFYTFGLSMYGNMPLIEPQEYREEKRIEEFVIVIDVSMSTSGALVRQFLEQTYAVLSESDTYLKRVNIHILQCDEAVLSDVKITSREQLEEYMRHFTLLGGGGTDFRPAFAYVEEMVERKLFRDLRGMLYFTDGYGIYPRRRPSWETAFLFLEEDHADSQVPPWAIRLVLAREQEPGERGLRTDFQFV